MRFLPYHTPTSILQAKLLISGQLCPTDFTNVWQLPKFLGWEAALLWKFIVLNSPQNFSFVTCGEVERWPWGLGRKRTEYRKESMRNFAYRFEAGKKGEHKYKILARTNHHSNVFFTRQPYQVFLIWNLLQLLPWLLKEDNDTCFPYS